MEGTKIIEQGIGELKNDALRFGLQGVKSDIVGSHPLESSYHSASIRQEEMKRKILANTYGSAFPLKMELDRKILSRFQNRVFLLELLINIFVIVLLGFVIDEV
ncbi:hypothetical protein AgCh_016165 [Apium graveolens]